MFGSNGQRNLGFNWKNFFIESRGVKRTPLPRRKRHVRLYVATTGRVAQRIMHRLLPEIAGSNPATPASKFGQEPYLRAFTPR